MTVLPSDAFARSGVRSRRRRDPSALAVALLFLSLAMMLLSGLQHPLVTSARNMVAPGVTEFVAAVASPLALVQKGHRLVSDLLVMREELERLRAENAALRARQWNAEQLQHQVTALAKASKLVSASNKPTVTARVAAYAAGPFAQTLVVEGGRASGLRVGFPVLDSTGALVGRIVNVYDRYARVLLVQSFASRIPVLVGIDRHRALAAGANTAHLRLLHLPHNADPKAGETVVTSGVDGVLPPGLRVGTVREGAASARATVQTSVVPHRIELVSIMLHQGPAHALAVELAGDGEVRRSPATIETSEAK